MSPGPGRGALIAWALWVDAEAGRILRVNREAMA